jgi:hypothetical protein
MSVRGVVTGGAAVLAGILVVAGPVSAALPRSVRPAPAGASRAVHPATAPKFAVYTAYADCPLARGCYGKRITNPRFPFPWYGAKNVTYVGSAAVGNVKLDNDPDTSAIRIDNKGATTLTISKISVKGCGSTAFNIWGTAPFKYPYKIARGKIDIFSSTSGDNFDGSEGCASPVVTVVINGASHAYADHTANAGAGAIVGGAYSTDSGDESTPWTKIAGPADKIVVLPATLGPGAAGKGYSAVFAAQDTNGAPVFTVTGALPPGLRFSSKGEDGTLNGKPKSKGTFHFTIKVTDSASPHDSGSKSYTFTVT